MVENSNGDSNFIREYACILEFGVIFGMISKDFLGHATYGSED